MKTLEVYPSMTLAHLHRQFNEQFPHLRIELTGSADTAGKVDQQTTIDQLAGHDLHSCFLIEGDMTVAELETDFQECFGLAIRVNRWAGCVWHDTGDTRHWTLNDQNQKGVKISYPGLTIQQ